MPRAQNQGTAEMLRPILRNSMIAAMALFAPAAVHAPAADAADATAGVTAATYAANVSVDRSVKIGLNKSLVLDLPRDARDILVSNPDIADAVIRTPRRIYVTGVKVGQSNVIIFDRAGVQIVTLELEVERDAGPLMAMMQRLIPNSNINIEIVSDNIVLSGTVQNAADARKAEDIANVFANGGAQAQPAPAAAAGGGVSISLAPGGSQTPTSSVINMLTIEGEDQVQLKVTVAEVQRNIAKQLGVTMNGNISVGSFTSCVVKPTDCSALGNPFGVNNKALSDNALTVGYDDGTSRVSATLRALEQTGMVKTLAEPTLTAISGENASFLAGGEFPVPSGVDATGRVSIQFKPFGVALAFTPVVLSEGRISLHVKTEVSAISNQVTVQLGSNLVIPGLDVRRAESTLELPSGGSMVLGGLLRDEVRQSISAFPGLGKLPVLGQLFRSRDFQRSETELVIIVTPYLVHPVPRSALATPDQGFTPASDAQAILLGNINRVYGGPSDHPASYAREYKGRFGFIYQ
jgi:pilus assembly protein CpaC